MEDDAEGFMCFADFDYISKITTEKNWSYDTKEQLFSDIKEWMEEHGWKHPHGDEFFKWIAKHLYPDHLEEI